jgi:hypothetical protein
VIARQGGEAIVITHGFRGLEAAVPSDESHETKEVSGKFHQLSLFDRNGEVKDNRTFAYPSSDLLGAAGFCRRFGMFD